MNVADVWKNFDSYNRTARLYPSLIVLAPIIGPLVLVVPEIDFGVKQSSVTVIALACFAYLFSSLARSRGKLIEDTLLKVWGAWPSTIILRHSDATIDPITKARYHAALSKLCNGLKFPTAEEEFSHPNEADAVYRSATRRLIELRRDKQYQLLHQENASYGFRRNLLGLKPIAIIAVLISGAIAVTTWWLVVPSPFNWISLISVAKAKPLFPLTIALLLSYLLIFIFFVNKNFVRQAAFEYAEALMRTLEGYVTKTRRKTDSET